MLNLKQRTNFIFYQIVGIGLVVLVGLMFLSIGLYPRLILVGRLLQQKLETVCGCANHWSFANHPFIFTFIIFVGSALTAFFCLAIIKIFHLHSSTNKFIKSNLRKKKAVASRKLAQVARELNLKNKIIEIQSRQPVVFCFGFWRPKICIADALVDELNSAELSSVLLHEEHHLLQREPAKLFIVKAVSKVLFFVPGLKFLAHQYSTVSELAADKWAIANRPNKISLAGALYKVLDWKEKRLVSHNLVLPSFNNITEERVARIADNNYIIKTKKITAKFLIFAAVMLLLVVFFYTPVYFDQSAVASHGSGVCLMEKTSLGTACQMSAAELMNCNMNYLVQDTACDRSLP